MPVVPIVGKFANSTEARGGAWQALNRWPEAATNLLQGGIGIRRYRLSRVGWQGARVAPMRIR